MKAWILGAILIVCSVDVRAQTSNLEKEINQRNKASNGIVTPGPKVYDDFLLQQMLNAAEARLASMQALDSTALAGKLGAVTGAQQTINSFAINAQGPALPAAASKATAPASTAPAATTTMPTSFGVSSADVLNEQMQLTYEIANLRLLLEGAISDRFDKGGKSVKPRTTLGFSVTLSPRYRDAVAIVEVHVSNKSANESEPPAITALLPREKTYNVAAIRDSSFSVGAGAVTQVFGVSGSFLHGSKSYYLVQDQDTVALQLELPYEEQSNKTAFLWQLRPVLGRHFVTAGMKQMFVQLAFSNSPLLESPGDVSVTTYWCHYDISKGIVGRVIPGSLRKENPVPIPRYNLAESQQPTKFSNADLEDLGNGQMLVRVHGNFLNDTAVRIGPRMLTNGPGGLTLTQIGMEFTAPIAELATKDVVLVVRDGSEIPLVIPHDVRPKVPRDAPVIKTLQISDIDETKSLVSVQLSDASYLEEEPPLVFVLGDKVFGYSDAPFFPSKDGWLRAIVPTALLLAHPTLTVKPLFAPPRFLAQADLNLTPFGQSERIVLFEKTESRSSFLLYGSRLADAKLISPEHVTLLSSPDKDTLRRFDLTAAQLKGVTHVFIQRGSEHPILLALPKSESESSSANAQQQISISGTVSVKAEAKPAPRKKKPARRKT